MIMGSNEKNIVYGGPLTDNYTNGCKSFGEMCLNKLQNIGDAVILEDALTARTVTGSELRSRSINLATRLMSLGLKEADTIGICTENRAEYAYVLFASFYLGVTVTPFNVAYTESELQHCVNLTKPRIIFVSPQSSEKVIKISKQNSFIENVVVFGDKSSNSNNVSYYSFLGETKELINFISKPVDMDNKIVLILYSSGTTGMSKGVKLSQLNVINAMAQQKFCRAFELQPEAIVLSVIPWFHAFGCIRLLGRILSSVNTIYLTQFEEHNFLRSIEKYKINSLSLVPSLIVFLAKSPLVDQYDLSSIKSIYCGAAAISKELINTIENRLNIKDIRQSYGMTESTVGITVQTSDYHKSGSVGILRSGMWGKVIDIETGATLGANQSGELLFKGITNMKGYIGNPKATSEAIDKDGWLHSGDIGYYDQDGEWFIVDRLKELIKYKGFQVPPAELEAILLQHPKVSDACVVGLPDEKAGELPLAFIVKQPNESVTPEEIIDFVAGIVSASKRIRGGVRFINAIPRNQSGKMLRKELRKLLQNQVSKL